MPGWRLSASKIWSVQLLSQLSTFVMWINGGDSGRKMPTTRCVPLQSSNMCTHWWKSTVSFNIRHESRGTYYDSVKVADMLGPPRKNDHDASTMLLDQVICLDEIKLSLMAQGLNLYTSQTCVRLWQLTRYRQGITVGRAVSGWL